MTEEEAETVECAQCYKVSPLKDGWPQPDLFWCSSECKEAWEEAHDHDTTYL